MSESGVWGRSPQSRIPRVARVLVVEDSPDIAELIKHYLERAGYETTVHGSGRDGLIAARQAPPDAVVLDIMLPGMVGLQVCQALRSEPSTSAHWSKMHSRLPIS